MDTLNIEIRDGSIVGLIGPNGAGKTTTISMMIGIEDVTKGDISINSNSIKGKPIEVKKQIGYVSDYHSYNSYYIFYTNVINSILDYSSN